jgi:hypothetical protein
MGVQRSHTEKTMIIKIPNQKAGVEAMARQYHRMALSTRPPLRAPASRPRKIPMIPDRNQAVNMSSSEALKRSPTTASTGRR